MGLGQRKGCRRVAVLLLGLHWRQTGTATTKTAVQWGGALCAPRKRHPLPEGKKEGGLNPRILLIPYYNI